MGLVMKLVYSTGVQTQGNKNTEIHSRRQGSIGLFTESSTAWCLQGHIICYIYTVGCQIVSTEKLNLAHLWNMYMLFLFSPLSI